MTNVFDNMGIGKPQPGGPFGAQPNSNGFGQTSNRDFLGEVTSGNTKAGQRIVISGVEKVGKTTLACNAPRALLVPLEMGFAAMNIAKTPLLTTFEDVMALIAQIKDAAQRGQFPYMSLIFDTATALERLIHESVLQRDPAYSNKNGKGLTMEAALGGYGKAYQFANELFDKFTKACDELAFFGGINIIVTCHVFAAKVIDPAYGEYDTWDLLLHSPKNQKNYGKREMITQWADMVGFLHEPLFVTKGEGMNQATSRGSGRVLAVDRTPGYVAGNRYGISGTLNIPPVNGWNWLAEAIWQAKGIDVYNRDV